MVLESVSWAIAGPECLPHVVVVRSTHVHGVWESPGPAVSVPASQLLLLLWNCGGVRGGEAREVKMGREEREKKERELKGRAGRAGAGTGLGDGPVALFRSRLYLGSLGSFPFIIPEPRPSSASVDDRAEAGQPVCLPMGQLVPG